MGRQFVRASTQYYQAATATPDRTAAFSIGAWIYHTALPSGAFQRIAEKGQSSSTGYNWRLEHREFFGRAIGFLYYGTANREMFYAVTLSLLQWHHIMVAVDWTTNPDTIRIYHNGVQVANNTSLNDTPVPAGTQQVRVGNSPYESQAFDGRIAGVFTTPVCLGTQHAAALWQGRPPDALGVPLDSYWPLHGTGSVEPDASGNGHHLVPSASAPSPTQHPYPIPAPPIGRPGRFWLGAPPPPEVGGPTADRAVHYWLPAWGTDLSRSP